MKEGEVRSLKNERSREATFARVKNERKLAEIGKKKRGHGPFFFLTKVCVLACVCACAIPVFSHIVPHNSHAPDMHCTGGGGGGGGSANLHKSKLHQDRSQKRLGSPDCGIGLDLEAVGVLIGRGGGGDGDGGGGHAIVAFVIIIPRQYFFLENASPACVSYGLCQMWLPAIVICAAAAAVAAVHVGRRQRILSVLKAGKSLPDTRTQQEEIRTRHNS